MCQSNHNTDGEISIGNYIPVDCIAQCRDRGGVHVLLSMSVLEDEPEAKLFQIKGSLLRSLLPRKL